MTEIILTDSEVAMVDRLIGLGLRWNDALTAVHQAYDHPGEPAAAGKYRVILRHADGGHADNRWEIWQLVPEAVARSCGRSYVAQGVDLSGLPPEERERIERVAREESLYQQQLIRGTRTP